MYFNDYQDQEKDESKITKHDELYDKKDTEGKLDEDGYDVIFNYIIYKGYGFFEIFNNFIPNHY